jgi:hypothetical protein
MMSEGNPILKIGEGKIYLDETATAALHLLRSGLKCRRGRRRIEKPGMEEVW